MSVAVLSNNYPYNVGNISQKATSRRAGADIEKPTWNGKKAFKYIEDMNAAGLEYGARATQYYASKTAADGEISVADLKKQIEEWFPEYTLTSSEPRDVVKGKHYLYIDDSQLKKMASDSSYRAKVYGLMDREYATGQEYTMTYSDGVNKTAHITGSIFSLCEANQKYAGADGVPYLGSCTSDAGFSSSQSHLQVRNQSFLYDNLDPAKSAKKSRTMAAKSQADSLPKKRIEKKKASEKEEKKKQIEKIEEKRKEKRAKVEEEIEKQMDSKDQGFFTDLNEELGLTIDNRKSPEHFDAKV